MSVTIIDAFAKALNGANGRVVQLPHPNTTFLAQNYNGRAALVARVTLRPEQQVPDGRGYSVSIDRNANENYVRITSSEEGISLLFAKFVNYILERTSEAEDSDESSRLFVNAVNEFWRFTKRKAGRLSEGEVRGLTAELLLLLHLQRGDTSRTWEVFQSWGGPFQALHDFSFPQGNAVEVKSTHLPPSEVRVSSLEQVQELENGLDLVVLPLERTSPGIDPDIRFVELVKEAGAIASECGGEIMELWESILVALGLDLTDEYYEQWNFICGDWLRFKVTDGFPSIHKSAIPDGVTKVTYALRLGSLDAFRADFFDLRIRP